LPVFFPPEGCLGQAPVPAHERPVDALLAIVVEQAWLPELQEDARFDPLLEAVVGGGAGTELGGIKGLPRNAGAQDEEDGIGTNAVRGAWLAAAEGVGVHVLGDAKLHDFPEFLGDAPVVGDVRRVHNCSSGSILKQREEL
jgi:hypothetical protein